MEKERRATVGGKYRTKQNEGAHVIIAIFCAILTA